MSPRRHRYLQQNLGVVQFCNSSSWVNIACTTGRTPGGAGCTGGSADTIRYVTNTDSGATWTQQTGSGSLSHEGITGNSDLSKLFSAASDTGGGLYTSTCP